MFTMLELINRLFRTQGDVPLEGSKLAPEPVGEPEAPTMPQLTLAYECKPFIVTQKWGVHDPATYSRFGFADHNGIDVAHGINRRLRAPFPYKIVGTQWQPNGGGNVLSIVSTEQYERKGGVANVRLDYLHLSKYVRVSGSGKTGDLLAVAGNTGFSTGPHTHIKATWVQGDKLDEVDTNDAANTFNQLPFYTGKYSADII